MTELLNLNKETQIGTKVPRSSIVDFENKLRNIKGAFIGDNELCPLKHSFCDSMFVREIFIPKGTYLTGKIHKHEHPNFLLKGKVRVATEEGIEELTAPLSMISKAGTKRALYVVEDCTWVVVHQNPTNTQDISELEEMVIAKNYEEYDLFAKQLNGHAKPTLINQKNEITNCGIIALKNISDLEIISVKTLLSFAIDNGFSLIAYKVPASEIKKTELPAIFHAKNHFVYIGKNDSFPEIEYTGIVLSDKELNHPKIKKSELKNINGGVWVTVAVGAASTIYAIAESEAAKTKAGQAERDRAAAVAAAAAAKAVADAKAAADKKEADEKKLLLMGKLFGGGKSNGSGGNTLLGMPMPLAIAGMSIIGLGVVAVILVLILKK